MGRFHAVRLLVFSLTVAEAWACLLLSAGFAAPPANLASERAFYHADPEHLWNRLHKGLFVRLGPDKQAYGRDRLEPLLWTGSKHLLEERSHRQAVTLLEEFLKHLDENEKLTDAELKRAVLQRDLWLVFNWLVGPRFHSEPPELDPQEVTAAQGRLRPLLAAAIHRLALTPDQISKLPDNYAQAVGSGEYAGQFDPEHPDQPYLPADLFVTDGPWVCLGRTDGPVAPAHQEDAGTNPFTNSAFLLFLRLPAGRAATLDYLKQLRQFDQPFLVEAGNLAALPKHLPNPQLPPLPAGTQIALVRRALLVSSAREPMATALTESVQLRVYREVPDLTAENIRAALENGTDTNRRAQSWQIFHEFQLSRSRLFAGRAGGLRPVEADERDFPTPFSLTYQDMFEYSAPSPTDRPFTERTQTLVKQDCFACHSLPGISSFNSFLNYRNHLHDRSAEIRPFTLSEMPVSEVTGSAVMRKQKRPNWIALRKLITD